MPTTLVAFTGRFSFILFSALLQLRPVDPPAEAAVARPAVHALSPSCGATSCANRREVVVDTAALGVSPELGGRISYDFHDVTAPIRYEDLDGESELSLAVRLIISEVGADRLIANRYGLDEAIGILYTVDNRLNPDVYNPLDVPHAPAFPGCGPKGTFAACINAQQYLGMSTWRALNPASRYRPELLHKAVDVAVTAWWLQENRLVDDITDGATSYVHRCGGRAYGMTTPHCDGHLGRRGGDVPGANPYTGPLVFKAPSVFRKGSYVLRESRLVDYVPRRS